jgi:membrane associated rhomboid family serine protease
MQDTAGHLLPHNFPQGIDKAIRDYRSDPSPAAGVVASTSGVQRPTNPTALALSSFSDTQSYSYPARPTATQSGSCLTGQAGSNTYGLKQKASEKGAPQQGQPLLMTGGTIAEEDPCNAYESISDGYGEPSSGPEAASERHSVQAVAGTPPRSTQSQVTPVGPLQDQSSQAGEATKSASPSRSSTADSWPAAPVPRSSDMGRQAADLPVRQSSGARVKPPLAAGGVAGIRLQQGAWGRAERPAGLASTSGGASFPSSGSARTPAASGQSQRSSDGGGVTAECKSPCSTPRASVTVISESHMGAGGRTTTFRRTSSRSNIAGGDTSTSGGSFLKPDGSTLQATGSILGSMEGGVSSVAPSGQKSKLVRHDQARQNGWQSDAAAAQHSSSSTYVPPDPLPAVTQNGRAADSQQDPVPHQRNGAAWNAGQDTDPVNRAEQFVTGGKITRMTTGPNWGEGSAGHRVGRGAGGGRSTAEQQSPRHGNARTQSACSHGRARGGEAEVADGSPDAATMHATVNSQAENAAGQRRARDAAKEHQPLQIPVDYARPGTFGNSSSVLGGGGSRMSTGYTSDAYLPTEVEVQEQRQQQVAQRPRLPRNPYQANLSAPVMLQGIPSTSSQAADFALARKLAAARNQSGALSTSAIFTMPPRDMVLHHMLKERMNESTRGFAALGPIINIIGLVGFLVSLAFNDWTVVDVNENPWLGVTRSALQEAGALCTVCITDGQWWRLFTSLFIPAGIAQMLFNGLLFASAALLAGRTGMSVWSFVACTLAGAVGGALASAVGAPKTVHSTSSALPAAAASTALVSILAVRRFLQAWRLPTAILFLWLGLLAVASLAPYADTFATVGGSIMGAICASSALAPQFTKARLPPE